jgi:hypothetical protein
VHRVKDARATFLADITKTRQNINKALDEAEQWLVARFDDAEQMIITQATEFTKNLPYIAELDMIQQKEIMN